MRAHKIHQKGCTRMHVSSSSSAVRPVFYLIFLKTTKSECRTVKDCWCGVKRIFLGKHFNACTHRTFSFISGSSSKKSDYVCLCARAWGGAVAGAGLSHVQKQRASIKGKINGAAECLLFMDSLFGLIEEWVIRQRSEYHVLLGVIATCFSGTKR